MVPEKKISEIWSVSEVSVKPVTPQTEEEISELLLAVFCPSSKSIGQPIEKNFQLLIKTCSVTESLAVRTVTVMSSILSSEKGNAFSAAIFQSCKSCSLIRILIAKLRKSNNHEALRKLMEKIAKASAGHKSPLSGLVNQFLLMPTPGTSQRRTTQITVDSMVEKLKDGNKLDENKFLEEMKLLSDKQDGCLEKLVQKCMNDSISSGSSIGETRAACRALIEAETEPRMLQSTASLFIDWLELIDPEVISSAPDLQRYLLFAKKHLNPKSTQRSSQPYLLALLTHQSNWCTVRRSISCLLTEHDPIFDPTSVLDFLWACIHIPRIWQGRENKTSKNRMEDVLGLNVDQTIALVDYVVDEASLVGNQTEESHDFKISNESAMCIGCRTELIISCVCEDDIRLKSVVQHIEKIVTDKSTHWSLYHHLLLELYLQRPYLMSWLNNTDLLLKEGQLTQRSLGQLDIITHRLLSSLGQGGVGSQAENRMYDANIALRKVASEHPLLFLRQLPMLAALLKGKTDFTASEMMNRNYTLMYVHILGLLELLQPHIFRKDLTSLPDIINAYFTLIQRHGVQRKKTLSSLILKFVTFLDNFVNYDAQKSVTMLKKHMELLGHISQMYPEMNRLKSLLAGLNLPRQDQSDIPSEQGETTEPLRPTRPSSPWTVAQLYPYHRKLNMLDTEIIMEVLKEMDEVSKRKVDLLEHFVTDLKRLMYEKNDRCRNTTYSLVMRLIRYSPRRGSDFVPTFLQCLGDENPDVVTTALKNLAEFSVLCQDQVGVILQKAFTVGINTMAETSTYISETLQLLNLNTAAST